ncbi:hypothetical protein HHK36_008970 [Tetracentron sinense]|uniref:Uncharacterized protein n=1 Tax=Tetracentron sinense TaxID=13715 RepID=A0A834ZC81_TETSI|nr:hypothetical protein HHK36_008970 [Tetracentron sinense]
MSATPDINTPTESILEPGQALYLHHSDNPGTILVSQPLNGDNYATWSRSMSMALSAKNKTGFIDGSMPKPNASSTKYSLWVRCNNMVSSWLLNSINPDLAHSVLYIDSAYEIWTDLKERFSQSNAPRIFQIKRSISSHIQGQNSIASYFNKLKGYWDELASYISLPTCSCGALKSLSEHEQREKNLQFLMGLNDTYSTIRGQILLMDPLPSLNKTYSLVFQEERQRAITMSTNNVDASALLANAASTGGKRRERPTCENCGWVGHTKAKCYKLHGYPPGHRLHKTGRPTSKQNSSNDDFSRVPPIESIVPSFTPEQYRQILSLLNDGNPVANFAARMKRMVLKLMLQLISLLWLTKASAVAASIAKPSCPEKCGNVSIPYPFGIGDGCYINKWFEISCNHSLRPFLKRANLEVLQVSLLQGTVRINSPVVSNCFDPPPVFSGKNARVDLRGSPFYYSEIYNRFAAAGCDNLAFAIQDGDVIGGCMSICNVSARVPNGCNGIGCCQTQIPFRLQIFEVNITSTGVRNARLGCRSAFLVQRNRFSNSSNDFYYRGLYVRHVPAVLEWGIANGTCDFNQTTNSSCSTDARCSKDGTEDSYNCYCKEGYSGNPYLPHGCQDVDECKDPNRCNWECINTLGSYICSCPPGFLDFSKNGTGANCIMASALQSSGSRVKVVGLGIGVCLGLLFLLLASLWIYRVVKRKQKIKLKQKFFKQKLLMYQQMSYDESSVEKTKIFTAKELKKATDNYNENRILGQGGHGTVYKGMLMDGRIVAVKKSKIVDEGQIEQFINEVVILSQINHRNVVKLYGCCLETEVPLLVYEFISNGTLFDHIHDQSEEFPVSWNDRLRIATEVAGAVAYLHSAASIPIYHRDIKSANILLDEKHRAKVADFGTSRSIPIDETHLTTLVQGTFGYLDPEYFQSSQFTEKSDVYSFGVVLVELLTGQKPFSSIRSQEERSLAAHFISSINGNHLLDILDARVVTEYGKEELIAVANLAKRCLNLNGKNRPTMKEVTMELEGMRMNQGNLPIHKIHAQEVGYYITETSGPTDACSTLTGYASLENNGASSLDTKPFLLNASC